MRNEALAAAGFVFVARADFDTFFRFDGALRIVGGAAAFDADRVGFCDKFGNRKKLRHWLERLAGIILIEAGNDDALTRICKFVYRFDQPGIEKLAFVDRDDLCFIFYVFQHLRRGHNGPRKMRQARMRSDLFLGITVVDSWFENLNLLPRDLRPAYAPDQLLGFSRKHRTDDDLYPACPVLSAFAAFFRIVERKFFNHR